MTALSKLDRAVLAKRISHAMADYADMADQMTPFDAAREDFIDRYNAVRNLDDLEQLFGEENVTWCETSRGFDRYAHPSPTDPDGASSWICPDCGLIVPEIEDGCECGFGADTDW